MQNNVGPDRISSGRNFELSWPSRNRRHNDAAISISSSPTYHPSSFELPIVGNGGWGNADWELRWSHMANCTRETHSASPWVCDRCKYLPRQLQSSGFGSGFGSGGVHLARVISESQVWMWIHLACKAHGERHLYTALTKQIKQIARQI